MFTKTMTAAVALAAASFLAVAPASADPLAVDGGWHEFSFGGQGSAFSPTYEFTLSTSGWLKVTDAFLSGDQFEVYSNSALLGATSVPGSQGDQINGDYDTAFADARWSSGAWLLGPGSYSIEGIVLASPFGGGGGAMRVDTAGAVPEPSTWAMMIGGLGLAGVALRRRRATTVSFA
jgi:hypothetical protein